MWSRSEFWSYFKYCGVVVFFFQFLFKLRSKFDKFWMLFRASSKFLYLGNLAFTHHTFASILILHFSNFAWKSSSFTIRIWKAAWWILGCNAHSLQMVIKVYYNGQCYHLSSIGGRCTINEQCYGESHCIYSYCSCTQGSFLLSASGVVFHMHFLYLSFSSRWACVHRVFETNSLLGMIWNVSNYKC